MDYVKSFENKVLKTIKKYELFNKKDKIVVAVSGGKDSMSILYLLKKYDYNVSALFIDLNIKNNSEIHRENISKFCKNKDIKLYIVDLKKETNFGLKNLCTKVQKKRNLTNCSICGVFKRYYLNKKVKELGVDKIVTGHNLDDEVENVLLNIFNNNFNISLNSGIKSAFNSKFFIDRVKPLYFITNEETRDYAQKIKLNILDDVCPLRVKAFRFEVRQLIEKLNKIKSIKLNIVNNFNEKIKNFRKINKNINVIKKCEICKEATRRNICKKCELLQDI